MLGLIQRSILYVLLILGSLKVKSLGDVYQAIIKR